MGIPSHQLSKFLKQSDQQKVARPKRIPKVRECRAKMDPLCRRTTINIPGMKLTSEANAHTHWRERQKRRNNQWQIVELHLKPNKFPPMPLLCRIVRIGPSRLDSDNGAGSAKHVRDAIADYFGIDDRDETKIEWHVAQEKGPYGVRIEIAPARDPNGILAVFDRIFSGEWKANDSNPI